MNRPAFMLSGQPCACGCGRETNLAVQNSTKHGYVKGQPMRYCRGHGAQHSQGRRKRWSVVPTHPAAYAPHFLVPVTRLRVEALLGRYLKPVVEVVMPMRDTLVVARRGYQNLLLYRRRAKAACGHANWLRCIVCGDWGADVARSGHVASLFAHERCRLMLWADYGRGDAALDLPEEWKPARRALYRTRAELRRM